MQLPHVTAALATVPLALSGGGRIEISTPCGDFATFHCGEDDRVPYLWPVLGPGGAEMTRAYPMEDDRAGEAHDHPHHQSLWFAHGNVNGHDFWHGGKGARIASDEVPGTMMQGTTVETSTRHTWLAPDGTALLREARAMVFTDVGEHRAIDFTIELTAQVDVTFGDTKEGTFALRLHPALRPKGEVATGTATNSEGDANVWGKRARWVDYSGAIDGEAVGVAVFDHPDNLRHPTWWHARDYGLVGANPFGRSDFERAPRGTGDYPLAAGEALTFRYRVWLHAGPGEREALDAVWREWAGVEEADEGEADG